MDFAANFCYSLSGRRYPVRLGTGRNRRFTMAEVIITEQNYEEEVLEADGTVLLDFWANWCVPCRLLAPVVAEIAEEQDGTLKVGTINTDEQPHLAARYGISAIPSLVVLRNGKPPHKAVGLRSKEEILSLLN